jgi:ADP-ribosylglycohydrolase
MTRWLLLFTGGPSWCLLLAFGLGHLEFRTLACMAGGIAQAYYGTIPDYIVKEVKKRLDKELLKVAEQFNSK